MHTDIELLAPARNKEIGIAAINCGADAVYIAGPSFGARVNAGNDIEDIAGLCRHAHKFGARVYVTVNTILYENELQEAFAMMEQCAEAGCDAFIIQDLAITEHFAGRKDFPPFFASTQCAIRTPGQAAWLESLGIWSFSYMEHSAYVTAATATCPNILQAGARTEANAYRHAAQDTIWQTAKERSSSKTRPCCPSRICRS